MGWIDELVDLWRTEHDPLARRTTPKPPRGSGYEVIRLPDKEFLVGKGRNWVSSLEPDRPPVVINLSNGNRMWQHEGLRSDAGTHQGYIISTAGLKPNGELDHCWGGGCQNRAFANYTGLRTSAEQVDKDYLAMAKEVGAIEDKEFMKPRSYPGVPLLELVHPFAENFDLEMTHWPKEVPYDVAIEDVTRGILYGDSGAGDLGTHLVAVRNGLQVVPHPSQMFFDFASYPSNMDLSGFSKFHQGEIEFQMKELEREGYDFGGDVERFLDYQMDEGLDLLLPTGIEAVFTPRGL